MLSRYRLSMLMVVCAAALLIGACAPSSEVKNAAAYEVADYGAQYYTEYLRVVNEMWKMEAGHIDSISTLAAEKLRAGHTVVWDCTAGHSCIYEVDLNLPCLPKGGMVSAMEFSGQKATIDKLTPDDMLITNYINEQTVAAHERGVHIVGVTNSYFRNSTFSEADNLDHKPNYNDLRLEDISDDYFDSHMHGQIGLVDVPSTPEMKVAPGSGNYMITLYWLVTCEVAAKMKVDTAAASGTWGQQYMDTLLSRLDDVFTKQDASMRSTAAKLADMIGAGGHIWVDSSPGSVTSDASGASMGLIVTNLFPRDGMKTGDIYVLAEASDSTSARTTAIARDAKAKGVYIVALCPETQTELRGLADAWIDNKSPEGYGLFEIPGQDRKIGCVGSLINCVVYDSFSMWLVREMNLDGRYPKFWMSYNWAGSSSGYFEWLQWSAKRVGW